MHRPLFVFWLTTLYSPGLTSPNPSFQRAYRNRLSWSPGGTLSTSSRHCRLISSRRLKSISPPRDAVSFSLAAPYFLCCAVAVLNGAPAPAPGICWTRPCPDFSVHRPFDVAFCRGLLSARCENVNRESEVACVLHRLCNLRGATQRSWIDPLVGDEDLQGRIFTFTLAEETTGIQADVAQDPSISSSISRYYCRSMNTPRR